MPCYRCGTRQEDPEPGKGSPWRRGVVSEHQVLVCPACQQAALADLTRCHGCRSTHLIRRLDQVECLDCRLTRDAGADADTGSEPVSAAGQADIPLVRAGDGGDVAAGGASVLAAEVARALAKVLGRPLTGRLIRANTPFCRG